MNTLKVDNDPQETNLTSSYPKKEEFLKKCNGRCKCGRSAEDDGTCQNYPACCNNNLFYPQ
jgi:hypothetical protein